MRSDRWRNTVIKWLDCLVPMVFIVCALHYADKAGLATIPRYIIVAGGAGLSAVVVHHVAFALSKLIDEYFRRKRDPGPR